MIASRHPVAAHGPGTTALAGATRPPGMFVALHRKMLTAPQGDAYAALVSRHFSEIRGLINHNPRVGVKWCRMDGGRVLAATLHATYYDDLPTAINYEALRPRLDAFLQALARYGSPSLSADVDRHRAQILDICAPQARRSSPASR